MRTTLILFLCTSGTYFHAEKYFLRTYRFVRFFCLTEMLKYRVQINLALFLYILRQICDVLRTNYLSPHFLFQQACFIHYVYITIWYSHAIHITNEHICARQLIANVTYFIYIYTRQIQSAEVIQWLLFD